MPHGGGRAGGGGHHGGGHHHGGHHHGYHHHHHPWLLGLGLGFGLGAGGARGGGGGACGCLVFLGCFFFIFISIFIIVALTERYSGEGENQTSYFAPSDTRLISYSDVFCKGLTLKDRSTIAATLYILSRRPPLTATDNFTINQPDVRIGPGEYQYWNFYLYPGSNFSMDYCKTREQNVAFRLFRGQSDFDHWRHYPNENSGIVYFEITNPCPTARNFLYCFTEEGEYYFVFYNRAFNSIAGLQLTMRFERTLYEITDGIIVDECRAGGNAGTSECSVSFPYHSSYYALIVVDKPASDDDWDENVNIEWDCEARVWVYLLIVFVPLIFVTLCITGIVIGCCFYSRVRKKKYGPLSEETQECSPTGVTVESKASAPAPAPAPAPPPFDPEVSGAVPNHESANADPPPAYETIAKPPQ